MILINMPLDLQIRFRFIALLTLTSLQSSARAEVDFSREVLPILADKCFVCHGPDSHPDTDLRLDDENAATADRGGVQAINQQNPKQSELLLRILDTADPMPPADAEKQLSEKERETLVSWINEGGAYESHWAWLPPVKSDRYATTAAAIDKLVEHQLNASGISFADEASKETLARRVALVLTGLPPEPQWLSEFLGDESPDAYEKLVDRLLANPRFGEHQARYWLDAVRYGDTHGLHLDNRRGIFPYRDWVVRSFNENLPLDQFITWQLAGDLLESPSLEQKLATGFIRMNPSTGEGGAIAEEFQMKNNFDRVETFGTVFLGLSLTCARCHTHKYDPIEQREYYELLAFFNSTSESALDGNSYTYGTTIAVPADQNAWARWKTLEQRAKEMVAAQLASKKASFPNELGGYAAATTQWKMLDWTGSLKPIGEPEVPSANGPLGNQPDSSEASSNDSPAATDSVSGAANLAIKGFPGRLSKDQLKENFPAENQVLEVRTLVEAKIRQTIDVRFSGGAGSTLAFYSIPNDASAEQSLVNVQDDSFSTLATKAKNGGELSINLEVQPGKHWYRFRIQGFEGMDAIAIELNNRWQVLGVKKSWADCEIENQLSMIADPCGLFHQDLTATESIALSTATQSLADEIKQERSRFTTSLIASELPKPRSTRILRRGEYDLPIGDELAASTPAILGGWSSELPPNRLGLARWVVSEKNPLVTRVLLNRIWQRVFGVGLVRTPEDFGVQGQQATHPKLLDWLAVDFIESGWNLKEMLRAMVTSRTFRQSSRWRPDIDDPENRLLARASSYRLDAEVLRDLGLWASHKLDPVMGGEGIKPYQPEGMWAALAHPASNTKNYQHDSEERRNRRSLYVYWKRTSPHPMMTLFDAPDRESSCVRRSRTNTPLQSLGMLNETQRVEIGEAFAKHLIQQSSSDRERIHQMFLGIACRSPNATEEKTCLTLLEEMRVRYQDSKQDADKLLAIGGVTATDQTPAEEIAAWSVLTTTFLATDIAIMLY